MEEMAITEIAPQYLTPAQAARYSGIPLNTLNAWRYEGTGPIFYKPKGRVLYDRDELDNFIKSSIRKPTSVRAKQEKGTRNVAV